MDDQSRPFVFLSNLTFILINRRNQLVAAGTGALAAAVLGGKACGISPLEGDCHQPHNRAAKKATHKLENNYTKEVPTLFQSCKAHNRFPNLGNETPRECDQ